MYWSRALGKGIHLHDYEYFFKSFPMNLTNFELLLSWVRPHIRKTYIKKVFLKFRNIYKKTPVLESLLNNVAGLKSSNFFWKETPPQVFSCKYCEIFTITYFKKTSANGCFLLLLKDFALLLDIWLLEMLILSVDFLTDKVVYSVKQPKLIWNSLVEKDYMNAPRCTN